MNAKFILEHQLQRSNGSGGLYSFKWHGSQEKKQTDRVWQWRWWKPSSLIQEAEKSKLETLWGEEEEERLPAETLASLRFHGPCSFANASIFVILHNTTEHCDIQALREPFLISGSQFPSGFVWEIPCHNHGQIVYCPCDVHTPLLLLMSKAVPQAPPHALFYFPSPFLGHTKMLFQSNFSGNATSLCKCFS